MFVENVESFLLLLPLYMQPEIYHRIRFLLRIRHEFCWFSYKLLAPLCILVLIWFLVHWFFRSAPTANCNKTLFKYENPIKTQDTTEKVIWLFYKGSLSREAYASKLSSCLQTNTLKTRHTRLGLRHDHNSQTLHMSQSHL